MLNLRQISAQQIKNSQGESTLELVLILDSGKKITASVPQGASMGSHEAKYLDVKAALANFEDFIKPSLANSPILSIEDIDHHLLTLDGTYDKSHLGANIILATSLAIGRFIAKSHGIDLYKYLGGLAGNNEFAPGKINPMMVMIEGGKHGRGNKLSFQEFLCVPHNFSSFAEKIEVGKKIMESLKNLLEEKTIKYSVGNEKGFAAEISENEQAIELLIEAIRSSGFNYPGQVNIGLDVAASSIHPSKRPSIGEIIKLAAKYNITTIEDPLAEELWRSWQILKARHGENFLLVGDDLFTSNPLQLMKGIRLGAAEATIIKPNQIGTLSETISAIKIARSGRLKIIVSHRSGETMDDFIAELAVGIGAEYFKCGAPAENAPERMVKYQKIIEIEKQLAKGR